MVAVNSLFGMSFNVIVLSTSLFCCSYGEVAVGMRKFTKPTLLVTTKEAKMVMILASAKNPVFICPFENSSEEYGYILAFSIMPSISPEYVYYLCNYDLWDKIINNINIGHIECRENDIVWGVVDGTVSWNRIGKNVLWCGYSENPNNCSSYESAFPLEPKMLKDAIGDFILVERHLQDVEKENAFLPLIRHLSEMGNLIRF